MLQRNKLFVENTLHLEASILLSKLNYAYFFVRYVSAEPEWVDFSKFVCTSTTLYLPRKLQCRDTLKYLNIQIYSISIIIFWQFR